MEGVPFHLPPLALERPKKPSINRVEFERLKKTLKTNITISYCMAKSYPLDTHNCYYSRNVAIIIEFFIQ